MLLAPKSRVGQVTFLSPCSSKHAPRSPSPVTQIEDDLWTFVIPESVTSYSQHLCLAGQRTEKSVRTEATERLQHVT